MKTQDAKTQIQGALTKADLSKIIGGNSNPEEENVTPAEQRTGDVAPILIGGVLIGAGG